MELAENILNRFNISKPQRKFLLILFTTILTCPCVARRQVARGKINFRNLPACACCRTHRQVRRLEKQANASWPSIPPLFPLACA